MKQTEDLPITTRIEIQNKQFVIQPSLLDEEPQFTEALFAQSIPEFIEKASQIPCTCCPIGRLHPKEQRSPVVKFPGAYNAQVFVIGEAPGKKEWAVKEAFVGPSGNELMKTFSKVGLPPEAIYKSNINKCHPFDVVRGVKKDRAPSETERYACISLLLKEISLVRPKVILCVGLTAAKAFLSAKSNVKMHEIRGKVFELKGLFYERNQGPPFHPLSLVTYHPAHILRNRNGHSQTDDVSGEDMVTLFRQDLSKVRQLVDHGDQIHRELSTDYWKKDSVVLGS